MPRLGQLCYQFDLTKCVLALAAADAPWIGVNDIVDILAGY